jgi:hypothetical protein
VFWFHGPTALHTLSGVSAATAFPLSRKARLPLFCFYPPSLIWGKKNTAIQPQFPLILGLISSFHGSMRQGLKFSKP